LRVQPTAKPGQSLATLLLGAPAKGFASLVDVQGTGSTLFGESLWLSLTPALTVVDSGVLDVIGSRTLGIATPANPALAGAPLYFQSLVLDASAPNGTFRASNGESAVLHARADAITLMFRDAAAEGVTGDYDASVKDRIVAAPVRRRTVTI